MSRIKGVIQISVGRSKQENVKKKKCGLYPGKKLKFKNEEKAQNHQ